MRTRHLLALLALVPAQGWAASSSPVEDKLRDALRQSMSQVQELQAAQATQQAALTDAQQQREQAQQELAAEKQRSAQMEVQLNAATEAASTSGQQLEALRAQAASMQSDLASTHQALQKWQAAYEDAAKIAREKEGQRRALDARLKQTGSTLTVCQTKNDKLIHVATDILHLYTTADFQSVIRGSYERLLGLKRVELENIVQDYEDKILDQKFQMRPSSANLSGG